MEIVGENFTQVTIASSKRRNYIDVYSKHYMDRKNDMYNKTESLWREAERKILLFSLFCNSHGSHKK